MLIEIKPGLAIRAAVIFMIECAGRHLRITTVPPYGGDGRLDSIEFASADACGDAYARVLGKTTDPLGLATTDPGDTKKLF